MDKEYIRCHLPEEAPDGMLSWALKNCRGELGGDYMIYRNERIREPAPMEMIMDNVSVGKKIWAAYCTCTACNEDFYTERIPGGMGFRMIEGKDGQLYNWPTFFDEPGTIVDVSENDNIICPNCFEECRVKAARNIRGGRTKQIKVCTLQNIQGYTAIIYYLVWKTVHEEGYCDHGAAPDRAVVITEHGGLVYYTHRKPGYMGIDTRARTWMETTSRKDPSELTYSDWGSINNKKAGAVVYSQNLPDMDGTTGEKTGLRAWFESAGAYPLEYFKVWKKYKNVEALVLAGCAGLIEDAIVKSHYGYDDYFDKYLDLPKKKPHQILGMSKQTFRMLRERKRLHPNGIAVWVKYHRMNGKMKDFQFFQLLEKVRLHPMEAAVKMMSQDGDEPQKIFDYLRKQQCSCTEIDLLRDARRFAREIGGGQLTQEELWPRHLRAAHDRLVEQHRVKLNADEAAKWQEGFDRVRRIYAGLEWNDGDLAVILPCCNGDLVREGQILRHCVGGYGASHAKGNEIILFIRHYRRPDRCYYTLNVSFAGDMPRRIQLHGYGNERHGDRKQYQHRIPQKVLDFVASWEQEVMLPWWRDKKKKEKKTA